MGLLAVVALAVASAAASDRGFGPGPGAVPDSLRIKGEFGLWVRFDDSVRVSWMTDPPAEGMLEVKESGTRLHRVETPLGYSHTAAFPIPGARAVELSYGAADPGAERHATRIRLEDPPPPPVVVSDAVDSLFVIADIHGEYDRMIRVLRNAGVIDQELRWSAGRSHLAVLGDMMSRSRDVLPVLWFFYRLEAEAEQAGGRVHITLGNHEIMVMLDDLRYVAPKERWIADTHGTGYSRMFDPRGSLLGRWLVSKPPVIRIDSVLLAHGSVSDDYLGYTVEGHRDSLAAFTGEEMFHRWADSTFWEDPSNFVEMDSVGFQRRVDYFWGDRSVFWYRGYARSDTVGDELARVLDRYDSRIHVVGHTPGPSIREKYDGALILVNTVPFAAETLLLVRTPEGYERFRIGETGGPAPLAAGDFDGPATGAPGSDTLVLPGTDRP